MLSYEYKAVPLPPKSLNYSLTHMKHYLLFAVALVCNYTTAQNVDYSVVYVPQESGIQFTRMTSDNDMVCMPIVKRTRQGVGWLSNRILDISLDNTQLAYLSARNGMTNIFIKNIQQHFSSMGITTHQVIFLLHNDTIEGYERIDKFGKYIVETHQIRYVPLIKWWLKRFFDIIGALVGLAITGILFIIIAPQIYHADPGPVIYTSIRIGKNGRQFKFYKFRSMYQDADVRKAELMSQNKVNGLMFKIDNDPRIIPGIGNFIRKTSLDEFPQFWNVLKGNMSLVGTRPPTLDEWQQYEEGHRIRMSMRPGITGIWQVSGRSSITDFNEVVKMDEEPEAL